MTDDYQSDHELDWHGPDIATWGEDTDRLERDAEIDATLVCPVWGDHHIIEYQEAYRGERLRIFGGCVCGYEPPPPTIWEMMP